MVADAGMCWRHNVGMRLLILGGTRFIGQAIVTAALGRGCDVTTFNRGSAREDGPTKYGYQKSGCELAVTQTFGADRCAILRPGVVLGPREYVGRLPWWLRRVAAGGQVLAPGSPARSIQPADVRDLAAFAVRS